MNHAPTENSYVLDSEKLSGAYRQKMHGKYDDPTPAPAPVVCYRDAEGLARRYRLRA